MDGFFRELWRVGRELKNSDVGGYLTLAASVWIVMTATCGIVVRVARGVRALWRWLYGQQLAQEEEDYPEGS